jgi:DNA repair exonuclease SbcCD ATPase subunit
MEEKFLLDIGECANGNTEFLNCVKKKFGNDKYDKQEWEEKVKPQFEKDIATREVEIKKYETEISKNAILVNNINNIKSSINKINEEMKEALLKLNELNFSEKLTSNNFLKLWEEKVIIFDKEIEENNFNINKFNEEISSFKVIENALVNVRYNIKQKNKLNSDSLKIDLENIEKSIIKSNEDIIKQKEEIVQKNKMLVDLNSKITTNTKLLQEIQEKLNAKIELGEFLKQEKIKYHIMQKSFPILREEFNKILKRMFYGEIRVFIDNKFDITVVRNGLEKNFENFSEGEKKRLDLGFIFTIHEFLSQKNQINTNILIMDELLDSALDSEGTEAVVDYLSEIKLTRNIILITHRNENIEYDRKFVLKKENRFSVVKEIN